MKGITHFALGLCGVSFVEAAVHGAQRGQSLPFILAGAASLLPDTFDFRFARYVLHQAKAHIVPDPLAPDFANVADGLARAAEMAQAERQTIGVELHPMRLTADAWQSYTVAFSATGRIDVERGPIVNTGGETLAQTPTERATRQTRCRFAPDYTAELRVDRLSALSLAFAPRNDGTLIPLFLPWHRRWSHSLVTALLLALYTGIAFGTLAGTAVAIGFGLHLLADQLGFMGCALFWPYSAHRKPGHQLMHSSDTEWNVGTLLLALSLLFWNLYRFSDTQIDGFLLPRLLLLGVALPLAAMRVLRSGRRRAYASPTRVTPRDDKATGSGS